MQVLIVFYQRGRVFYVGRLLKADAYLGVGNGGAGMKWPSLIIGSVIGLVFFQAAEGQDTACGAINIATCPSFFSERCASDLTFRNRNASACLRIAAKNAVDSPNCAKIDQARCDPKALQKCVDVNDPLDRFFCEKGQASCPKSIPEISDGYVTVLGEFNKALEQYQPLLDLDVRKVNDKQSLCGYSLDRLRSFRTLAEQDRDGLKRFDHQLNRLGTCGDTLQSFLASERPKEITEQLWQTIQDSLKEGIKDVAARKGELNSKQEQLGRAPAQIDGLAIAFRVACAQKPSDEPTQPRRK
jgi:hypothetical protein